MAITDALLQWIVLRVDKQEYALHIDSIVEVLRMVAVRPLPDTAPWIAGLMNMRGRGVPVMDLRLRLGMPARPYALNMIIVVIQVDGRMLGLIVDQAMEFLSLPPESIRPTEGAGGHSGIVAGIANTGDRLILILEPRTLLASETRGLPSLPHAQPHTQPAGQR